MFIPSINITIFIINRCRFDIYRRCIIFKRLHESIRSSRLLFLSLFFYFNHKYTIVSCHFSHISDKRWLRTNIQYLCKWWTLKSQRMIQSNEKKSKNFSLLLSVDVQPHLPVHFHQKNFVFDPDAYFRRERNERIRLPSFFILYIDIRFINQFSIFSFSFDASRKERNWHGYGQVFLNILLAKQKRKIQWVKQSF